MARYITNLKRVKSNGEKGQDITTRALIAYSITTDQRFNSSGAGIRASARIETTLLEDEQETATFFKLTEEDWKLLSESVEDPRPIGGQPAYPWLPARRLLPMIDEIKNAGETEPVSEG